jgi:signal transduction histidine kinase
VGRALELYADSPISFQAVSEVYAHFDATQLVRIINNLINNAIQACEEVKQPKICVTITTEKKGIILAVEDNGKGIPKDLHDRIFEPTFTTKTSGMGLGLSMVKSIVETYDGSVVFDSTPDALTRFELRIPSVD